VIRLAAVGDLHIGEDSVAIWRDAFRNVARDADLLLLAGDLTRGGESNEAACLVSALHEVGVPIVAVLGNHDYHADRDRSIASLLENNGVSVLEGSSTVFEIAGTRVGVAGTKGFGGGFENASGSEFGEPEMKAFIAHTRGMAERLERALDALDADLRVALLHYAPIPETLKGERLEIYPFLGSHLLAGAIERSGADLVLHGHAHGGMERGQTSDGTPVRNVAQPVIQRPYVVYGFARRATDDGTTTMEDRRS
jgi:Icc-related predicted phosphoesterase